MAEIKILNNDIVSVETGKLGIGTTSPSTKLHIKDTSGSNELVTLRVENDLNYGEIGTQSGYVRLLSSGYLVYAGSTNSTYFYNGGSVVMSTHHTGNVGIGTSSPSHKLQVEGGIKVGSDAGTNLDFDNAGIIVRGSASGNNSYIVLEQQGIANWRVINRATSGNFEIASGSSSGQERLAITTSGNVGIGTTSPSSKLQVEGSLFINNSSIKVSENSVTNYYHSDKMNSYGSNYDWKFSGDTKMRITSGGNVGIGTTSPSTKLQAVVDFSVSTTDYVNGTAGSRILIKPFSSTGDTYSLIQSQDVGGVSNNALVLQPYGDNVGIGTTSPTSKLDVAGAVRALGLGSYFGNSATSYSYAVIGAFSNGVDNIPLVAKGYSGQTADLTRWVDSSNNILNVVDASGNVGIGTTSPSQKLDVIGRVRASDRLQSPALMADSGAGIVFKTSNGADRVIINNSGDVGIGTTSPSRKFEIHENTTYLTIGEKAGYTPSNYGPVLETNSGTMVLPNRTYWLNSNVWIDKSGSSARFHGDGGIRFSYYNGGTIEVMRLSDNGNIGIGLTYPTYKLDVEGTIGARADNYRYKVSNNQILSFSAGGRNLMSPLNGYLWHDLIAFDYLYTRTQEISVDGVTWEVEPVEKKIFNQKQNQAIPVISENEQAVRWTFQGVAWSLAQFLNIAFTYHSGDISKDILVESSADGINWSVIHTSVATPGISTKTCYLSSYGGDNYLRITIAKSTPSTNQVRISSIKLMTDRLGDQGRGREYEFPYSWDENRNIGIGLNTPLERLHVSGAALADNYYVNNSGKIANYNDTDTYMQLLSSNNIRFVTGNNERFRIVDNGDIGIGTTAPSTKLNISSAGAEGLDLSVDTSNPSLSGRLFLSNATAGQSVSILNSTGDLTLRTNAQPGNTSGNERMRISADGKVGVGTAGPTSAMHVVGAAMAQLRLETLGGPSNSQDAKGNIGDIAYDDNFMYIKTNNGWGRVPLDFGF